MEIIKADHHRLLHLARVPEPVHRPVDIDTSLTGFASLRSLRIYCFDPGSVIDGHAEDDEVLMVVLAGSIELTMSKGEVEEDSPRSTLSTAGNPEGIPCTAYLPPKGAYRLVPQTKAEVAYARATTSIARPPAVFSSKVLADEPSQGLLFEEANYPQRLRLRIVHLRTAAESRAVTLVEQSGASSEALVHVRTEPPVGAATLAGTSAEPVELESWDTVLVRPGEQPTLRLQAASSALLLVVLASAE